MAEDMTEKIFWTDKLYHQW